MRIIFWNYFLISFLLVLGVPDDSFASEVIIPSQKIAQGSSTIKDLTWKKHEVIFNKHPTAKDQPPLFIRLEGQFSVPDSTLIFSGAPVPNAIDFTLEIPVNKRVMEFKFDAIDLKGDLKNETFSIAISEAKWKEVQELKNPKKAPKRWLFSVSAGLSYLDYAESDANIKLNQFALTGKLAVQFRLIPNHLTLSGNTYFNLVSFITSQSSDYAEPVPESRFFGGSATVNYQLPFKINATSFSIGTGWYAWGMLGSNSYGISFLHGPQFLFIISTAIAHRAGSLYLKLAPIASSPGELGLTSRELAFGLSYALTSIAAKREWALSLDVSNLNVRSTIQENSAILSTVSLGIRTNL